MKFVFLDIDGPMNTRNHMLKCSDNNIPFYFEFIGKRICHLDPNCIDNLNTLLNKTQAKLVICSSWRYFSTPEWFTLFLHNQGLKFNTFDFTPNLELIGLERADEILEFLKLYESNLEEWIVIDDSIGELKKLDKNHIIHVDTLSGFNSTHLSRAIRLLNSHQDV